MAAEIADQVATDQAVAADSSAAPADAEAENGAAQAGGCDAFLGSYVKGPEGEGATAEAEGSDTVAEPASQASAFPNPQTSAGSYETSLQCYDPNPDNTIVCIMDSKEVTCTIAADGQTICPQN